MRLHRSSGRTRLGIALAITTVAMWGVLPIVLSVVLRRLDPVTVSWFRFLVSSLVLLTVLAWRGELPRPSLFDRRRGLLLAIAVVGLGGNYVGYVTGLQWTTPANAQILTQMSPLLLSMGGIVIFGERFTRAQWRGFLLLIVGLAIFFSDQLLAFEAGRYLGGSLVLLAATAAWAIYGLAQKQLLTTLPSQPLMLCLYAGCALLLTPFAEPAPIATLTSVELAILIFCALNTVVAYGSFAASLEHLEASRVGAIIALTPVSTFVCIAITHALWPGAIPAEHVSIWSGIGALIVVAGSLRASSPDRAEGTGAGV